MARCFKSLRCKLPAVSSSPSSLPVTLDALKCLNQPFRKSISEPWPRQVPHFGTNHERTALVALNYCYLPDQTRKRSKRLNVEFQPLSILRSDATTCTSCIGLGEECVGNDAVVRADGALAARGRDKEEPQAGPTSEQLDHVFQTLSKDLPLLFVRRLSVDIYDLDMVFENNIRGTRTVGLQNYMTTVSLLKLLGHLRYAYIGLDLIKITKHPEDGTVKARWRIRGLGGLRVMFLFWKYKIWKWQELVGSHETWYDGFSTFYVGSNGKIFRHVADKVMPDNDQEEIKTLGVARKVALLFGLTSVPRPALSDMISFFFGGKKRSNFLK